MSLDKHETSMEKCLEINIMISFPEAPWKLAYRPKYAIVVNYFCVRERRMFCILALSLSFNSLADKFSRRRKKTANFPIWMWDGIYVMEFGKRFSQLIRTVHAAGMPDSLMTNAKICCLWVTHLHKLKPLCNSFSNQMPAVIWCSMRPAIWCTMVDGPMQLLDMDTFTRSHTVHIMKSPRQIFS